MTTKILDQAGIGLVLIVAGFVLGMLEILIFEPSRQLRGPEGGEEEPQ